MTPYAKMPIWALVRANEMFGDAWPCDGDTRTCDTPAEAQGEPEAPCDTQA